MTDNLCQLVPDFRGTLPPCGALASEKIDGWRCLYLSGVDAVPRLYTRGGIPLGGADHVRKALAEMERIAGERMFFDGEIQVSRPMLVNGEITLVGSLKHTKKWFETEWKWDDRENAGKLHLFDCLTMSEWRAGGGAIPLSERKQRLVELWQAAGLDPTVVMPVEDRWVFDADDALAYACEVWAAKGEGVVLKDPDSAYQRRRSPAWAKVKLENRSKWERVAWRIAA